LLASRAAIGEYQPTTRHTTCRERVPADDPFPTYYPRAVSDAVFYAAQASLKSRA
jgi:hypothetical protein